MRPETVQRRRKERLQTLVFSHLPSSGHGPDGGQQSFAGQATLGQRIDDTLGDLWIVTYTDDERPGLVFRCLVRGTRGTGQVSAVQSHRDRVLPMPSLAADGDGSSSMMSVVNA